MNFAAEIQTLIDFDDEDLERLRHIKPHIEPEFSTVVDEFCRTLNQRNLPEPLLADTPDQPDVPGALMDWLRGLFEAPLGPEAAARRETLVDLHHAGDWLPEMFFAAMHVLRIKVSRQIRRLDISEVDAAVDSFHKVFDFALARLLKTQRDDAVRRNFDTAATLAAGLSHEIYNPLNAITLHLSLLERQLQGKVGSELDWEPMLQAVRHEVQRIGMFTSELNDFSRPLDIDPRWFDIRQLIDEMLDTHSATLDSVGVDLESNLDGPPTVYGDPDRLEEAMLNLLHNAVEAIGESGTIRIDVSNAELTTIDVSDTGPGLDPGDRAQIFDLFYTTKASGTGLGLPLVRKIAEAHGGKAEAVATGDRDDSRGATFRLTLPRPAD